MNVLSEILSWHVLLSLPRDAAIILVAKVIRQISFGFMYMLVIYLTEIGLTPDKVGLLFFSTLLGDAIVSITCTSFADKFGRKHTLLLASVLSIAAGFIVATQRDFVVFMIGMTLGIISVSGSDCGPFLALELSCISEVSDASYRTKIMAWYNLFSCFASASGSLLAGRLLGFFEANTNRSLEGSCRIVMSLYTLLHLAMFATYMTLSPAVERAAAMANVDDSAYNGRNPSSPVVKHEQLIYAEGQRQNDPSKTVTKSQTSSTFSIFGLRHSKWIVLKLSLLFMLDAFAGGFVLHSVIADWFHERFGTSPATLGTVFFVCSLVAGITSLFSARIADFIGLVLTMVFTHLPAQICLMMIPLMPNQLLALIFLVLRATVGGMDVPARNSFVQGAVDPDERSAAAGATNVIRSVGSSVAPYLAGLLYADPRHTSWPFFIAGCLKITYDLSLMAAFSAAEEKGRNFWSQSHTTSAKFIFGGDFDDKGDKDSEETKPLVGHRYS